MIQTDGKTYAIRTGHIQIQRPEIVAGTRVKDAVGRWATVIDRRDNVLIIDHFRKYLHISNVMATA